MTLVIMAAGMGSRYGGLKQIEPIGNDGEFILDYSIYDAKIAGFTKVIFIIKEENYTLFRQTVGKRVEKIIETDYVFQKIDSLPEGFLAPAGRIRPWGTAHAILSIKGRVHENFAVINADDFYGRDSFRLLGDFLAQKTAADGKYHFCMSGFILENTLTENGHVARGVCQINENHYLTSVTERTKIQRNGDVVQYFEEDSGWADLPAHTTVSMNCWGFTPEILEETQLLFQQFLLQNSRSLDSCEFYLPSVVQNLIDRKKCDVKVLYTAANWYGVTYQEDKIKIINQIQEMCREGLYPYSLWKQESV